MDLVSRRSVIKRDTLRARELRFGENVPPQPCVTRNVSYITSQVLHVTLSLSLGHAFVDTDPSMPTLTLRYFTCYHAATPPPAAPASAVTCRRRQKSLLDGATDLLSQI